MSIISQQNWKEKKRTKNKKMTWILSAKRPQVYVADKHRDNYNTVCLEL